MGVYIPNMEMPETCDMCPIEGCEYINGKFTCPLIEIDLVRCGECKWYNPWHANHTNIDGNHCRNIDRPMKPTDFCSYGERRADEHNTERD